MAARPGDPRRLGATWEGDDTSFAVFSSVGAHGGSVGLCLLDDDGGVVDELAMWPDVDIWTCRVDGVGPGQRYAFRVHGPFDPGRGLLFDPSALLCDPYARALTPAPGDDARRMHSLVVDPSFDWGEDRPPHRAWSDTVLYETHVKGLTARHPEVPPELRGTYAGLASPPVLQHLTDLGVTAVELLPVHQFVSESFLLSRGLTNYWGYSTLGFFAPHAGYSAAGTLGQQVTEFKSMVRALHVAGIEVVLDVVFNHTAEGAMREPALSFRGLADDVYYRNDPGDPARYIDTTGTGNSVDAGRPEVLRLIMDSLRYWVQEMHVDGFRFDLAATLARQYGDVDTLSSFFALLYQDPVVGAVKLIAEPWDINAHDSYQVGRFPAEWAEWNDRYRDDVRDFWRGAAGPASLGYRLTGSSDLFGASRRGPDASINFVTAHDGKTLADLVSYAGKHNLANLEDNRDGAADDRGDNHGVEGPTDDPGIRAVRLRQQRNLLGTLLLSQGTPMFSGGDEIGRTQRGNNNAYCQDNEISWYDWDLDDDRRQLLAFTRRVVALQGEHDALRRRTYLTGRDAGLPLPDVSWIDAQGQPMAGAQWQAPHNRFLGFLLAGDRIGVVDDTGVPRRDEDIMVLLNAGTEPVAPVLPGRSGAVYTVVLDTTSPDGDGDGVTVDAGQPLVVAPRALLVAASPL
jgi:isoamylase